jgi:hypothetical protein
MKEIIAERDSLIEKLDSEIRDLKEKNLIVENRNNDLNQTISKLFRNHLNIK